MEKRRGIIAAGNWICDVVKFIDRFPERGMLTSIRRTEEGFGGCAHNVLVDLAALETDIPLYGAGCIGNDRYGTEMLRKMAEMGISSTNMHTVDAPTSFTDVMSETEGGARTFFHCAGANALLSAEQIDAIDVNAKIFHLGYILLLDELDKPDAEYGTVAARVLCSLQKRGYKTSVDVVSEMGERFRSIVLPSLRYTDYLILNEVEAGACTDSVLRDTSGAILLDKVAEAARKIMDCGVRELCVIHFPEGGYALDKSGESCYEPAREVAAGEIVSTVGAGDAFCAGALYAIHEEYPLREMLRTANASARFNLFGATATSAAPTLSRITQYLAEN